MTEYFEYRPEAEEIKINSINQIIDWIRKIHESISPRYKFCRQDTRATNKKWQFWALMIILVKAEVIKLFEGFDVWTFIQFFSNFLYVRINWARKLIIHEFLFERIWSEPVIHFASIHKLSVLATNFPQKSIHSSLKCHKSKGPFFKDFKQIILARLHKIKKISWLVWDVSRVGSYLHVFCLSAWRGLSEGARQWMLYSSGCRVCRADPYCRHQLASHWPGWQILVSDWLRLAAR